MPDMQCMTHSMASTPSHASMDMKTAAAAAAVGAAAAAAVESSYMPR
jgi:hypothetical protein